MKTREDLTEAKELVRIMSLYGALPLRQVMALFPGRTESMRNLISRYVKQKRLYYQPDSDFPAVISFFTEDDNFDIVVVPEGQENLISHALSYVDSENAGKRLVVVDDPAQIPKLPISNVAGFCTVDTGGAVSYFQID